MAEGISVERYIEFIKELVKQGGPKPDQFSDLNQEFNTIACTIQTSLQPSAVITSIREAFGEALDIDTIQGYGFQKPYGYAGDFYMIDKIYLNHISPLQHFKNWDVFFHTQKAPIAVRNRKQYFISLLSNLRDRQKHKKLSVLNIASGPCRGIYEYLESTHDNNIHFDCVDYEQKAIEYAKNLCNNYLDHITFHHRNAFRFQSDRRYDLVWSAGLFDYLHDRQFTVLIKRLSTFLNDNGELVIGNFHPDNSSRNYMEIVGDWYLNYRSEFDLMRLARKAGFCLNSIRIGVEEEYVNLFLHVKRGKTFL